MANANIKFYYNGIKANGGKLVKASYSIRAGYIEVWASAFTGATFGAEIAAAFEVSNDTDTQTDYFASSRFKVERSDKRFDAVQRAFIQKLGRDIERCERKGYTEGLKSYKRELERVLDLSNPLWLNIRSRVSRAMPLSAEARIALEGLHAVDFMKKLDELGL